MGTMSDIAPSTREQIVLAAERLFADHGLHGVSLRRIGAAAGNSNNSVVQYHFGTKEHLVQEIFEFRLPRLHARRAMLIAQAPPGDLRAWLDCQARAVLEQSELDGSRYAGFLEVLSHSGRAAISRVPEPYATNSQSYVDHLRGLLHFLPEPLRDHRLSWALKIIIHAAAERERLRDAGTPLMPFGVEVDSLVDGVVGFLRAPVSPGTHNARPADARWPLTV